MKFCSYEVQGLRLLGYICQKKHLVIVNIVTWETILCSCDAKIQLTDLNQTNPDILDKLFLFYLCMYFVI